VTDGAQQLVLLAKMNESSGALQSVELSMGFLPL
jgi:hypothetical protein